MTSPASADTALVTGASGFLGRCLCARLDAAGTRVVATSRQPPAGDRWRALDVEDAGAVAGVVKDVRPSVIFHLASYVRGTRDLGAVLTTFRANLASAVYVMAAAAEAGVRRVVMAASMEELPLDQPARFPYAVAKRAASEYGRFFQSTYGLEVVSARIAMGYGPGQRDAAKLVPHVILSQIEGKAPKLASGSRQADWTFVDDVADALIACGAAPRVEETVVEIGTGVGTSVGDIARRITAITGGPPPEIGALPDRANDRPLVADTAEAERRIGWRARVDLDEGLRRTVAWYRAERAAGRI